MGQPKPLCPTARSAACRDCEKLHFKYGSREVEPHRLVHTGRRWYLAAWDAGRNAYVSRSAAYTPYPHRAKVTLHASAEQAAERVPPGVGMLEEVDERTYVLSLGACSLDSASTSKCTILQSRSSACAGSRSDSAAQQARRQPEVPSGSGSG